MMRRIPLLEVYIDGYLDWPDHIKPGNFCYIDVAEWKTPGTVELFWAPDENVVVLEYSTPKVNGTAVFPCGSVKMMILKHEPTPVEPTNEEVTKQDVKAYPRKTRKHD